MAHRIPGNTLTPINIQGPQIGTKLNYYVVLPTPKQGPAGAVDALLKQEQPVDYNVLNPDKKMPLIKKDYANKGLNSSNVNVPEATPSAAVPASQGSGGAINQEKYPSSVHPPWNPDSIPYHEHNASEVNENANRVWFTPKEREWLAELIYKLRNNEIGTPEIPELPDLKRVIVFVLPEDADAGVQGAIPKFPWPGKLVNVYAASSGKQPVDIGIQVERCPASMVESGNSWAPILEEPLKIELDHLTASVDTGIIVNKDDHFRLKLTFDGLIRTKPITVELCILTSLKEG